MLQLLIDARLRSLQELAYTHTSFSQAAAARNRGRVARTVLFLHALRCSDPIDRRGAARHLWPRAQEPQTADLVEDASRAEREERHT